MDMANHDTNADSQKLNMSNHSSLNLRPELSAIESADENTSLQKVRWTRQLLLHFLLCLTTINSARSADAQCVLPAPGLVSWWAGDGNPDDIFGGNPGILMNGATFAPGLVGGAFNFDETNSFFKLPDGLFPYPTSGMGTTPFSFEVWFQTLWGGVILGQQTSAPFVDPKGWVPAIYVGTNGRLYCEVFWSSGGSADPIFSSQGVNDGIFHHVAVVFDGTNRSVYLDGVRIGSKALTQRAYATSYKYQLGTGYTRTWPAGNGGWYSFRGLMDEAAFYNRALTPDEVHAIYAAGSGGRCKPPVPLALTVVYSNDFQGAIGTEWSKTSTDVTPVNNRRFLGQFGNDTVTLTLSNLPPHGNLSATFDLFVINSWDGNNGGPDVWDLSVEDGTTLLHTTFQNFHVNRFQAYPGGLPAGSFTAGTGALEVNTLGYPRGSGWLGDSVYRLNFYFAHSTNIVKLRFQGSGLQGVTDESWGIDNLVIVADAPAISIITPTNSAVFVTPTNLLLTAEASAVTGSLGQVMFLADNVLLGTATESPYSLIWSNVPAGVHVLRARATDDAGRISESPVVTITVNGLLGEYFTNRTLSGTSFQRGDANINFDWYTGRPMPGIGPQNYSVRWTGELVPEYSETYAFFATIDDGARLWVGGCPVIDAWPGQPGGVHTGIGTISLQANQHYEIEMEYQQGPGSAVAELEWRSPSQGRQIVPASRLFPPVPGVNRAPNAPVILSPPADGWAVSDWNDPVLSVEFFSDPDSGQTQEAAEWEIWLTSASQLIWYSSSTSPAFFLTNRLSNGVFTGSHIGLGHLLPDLDYMLRVRHKDSSGATNAWGPWAERYFNTRYTTLAASTFDASTEGWSYLKTAHPELHPGFQWMFAGHPGGSLFVDEYSNGDADTTWYRAPEQFLGNKSGCYGGFLEYDIRLTIPSDNWNAEHVQFWSPNGMLVFKPKVEPGTDWTHFQVPLLPSSWHVGGLAGASPTEQQFLAVLATLTNLLIRAEYIGTSYDDNSYLDNVRLGAPHAVTNTMLLIRSTAPSTATIEWPTNAVGFQLEGCGNLLSGTWTTNLTPIASALTNELITITFDARTGGKFYRLRRF